MSDKQSTDWNQKQTSRLKMIVDLVFRDDDESYYFNFGFPEIEADYFIPYGHLNIIMETWGGVTFDADYVKKVPNDLLLKALHQIADAESHVKAVGWLKQSMDYIAKAACKPFKFDVDNFIIKYWGDYSRMALNQNYLALTAEQRAFAIDTLNEAAKRQDRPGYVYLIKSASGYYKIGRTKNPQDRIATFSVKLPFEVEYDHLIKADDMYVIESNLHEHFSLKRVNGEWFSLDSADIEFIKSIRGAE